MPICSHPPAATANAPPLRAPLDTRARPQPPISASQAGPAGSLAATHVRQVPTGPLPLHSPLHPASLLVTKAPATTKARRFGPLPRLPPSARQMRNLSDRAGPGSSAHLPVLDSAPPERGSDAQLRVSKLSTPPQRVASARSPAPAGVDVTESRRLGRGVGCGRAPPGGWGVRVPQGVNGLGECGCRCFEAVLPCG